MYRLDLNYMPASNLFVFLLTDLSDLDPNADLKSPISLVHEIALKRNLTVTFEVIRESGPPHVRTFVTVCIVGEYKTEGEGTGKKVSKKRAAELMLEELRKLPALPPTTLVRIKRKPTTKKKSRNLIKVGPEASTPSMLLFPHVCFGG
nr:double-stranded RNA-binding protein Staufen homolog 2-like [Procambarus clarkii]